MAWQFIDDDQDQDIKEPIQTPPSAMKPNPLQNQNPRKKVSAFGFELEQPGLFEPNQATKGIASGLTFGATEQIPGMKPEGGFGTAGQILGSIAPIEGLSKIFAAPIVAMAQKSPYFGKTMTALGRMIGTGITGAVYKDIENGIEGKPFDAKDLVEHGTQWLLLDAALQAVGLTGRFAKAMAGRIKGTGQSPADILKQLPELVPDLSKRNISKLSNMTSSQQEEVLDQAIKAIENIERPVNRNAINATPLEQPINKAEQKFFDRVEKQPEIFNEPVKPNEFKFEEVTEQFPKNTEKYETIAPKAENEAVFGENIQKDIENEFKTEQKRYNEKYDQVQEYVDELKLTTKAEDSIKFVKDMVTDLESVKTKPEGYSKVITLLNDTLQDLGLTTGTNYHFRGFNLPNQPVALSKLMELGRRLNKIAEYDIVGPSIKKKINQVARVVKNEIGKGLAQTSPELKDLWQTAEKEFGQTAEKFGNETVMKIRGMELPEHIARGLNFPTAIKQMKAVLSPKQFAQVERQILEKIDNMTFAAARKYYNEIASTLSQEAKALAKEAVRLKHPKSRVNQVEKIKESVLNDLEASIASGKRPDRTLKLMKTEKGRRLVNDTIKARPDKTRVMDYLQRQTLNDYASSFIKEGKIDFKTLHSFIKDPAFIENIRAAGGNEAVQFIRELEGLSKQFEKNLKLLEKLPETHNVKGKVLGSERGEHLLKKVKNKPLEARQQAQERGKGIREAIPTQLPKTTGKGKETLQKIPKKEQKFKNKAERYYKALSPYTKFALTAIGAAHIGITGTAAVATGALFWKFVTNRKVQQAFRQAVAQKTNPTAFLSALEHFDDVLKEEEGYRTEKSNSSEKPKSSMKQEAKKTQWQFVD